MAGVIVETECWLVEHGLPRLVDGRVPAGDGIVTIGPILSVLLLAEVLSFRNPDWPPLANVVAISIGLAMLHLLRRRLAGRRQADGAPRSAGRAGVDWPMFAVFLLAPALLQIIFGGSLAGAAWTLPINLIALGFVTLLVYAGGGPMLSWNARTTGQQLRASINLFTRVLPLLLISTTFLFMTAEVWQAVGSMSDPSLAVLLLLFGGLTVTFLLNQLAVEVRQLTRFSRPEDVVMACRGTPVAELATRVARQSLRRSRLRKSELLNVTMLVAVSALTQVTLVSLLVGAFFVLFGVVAISPAVADSWTGGAGTTILLSFGPAGTRRP